LSSPTRLLRVVSDAAGAMTTDTALSQSDLVQIGESLRGVPDGDYQFIQASNVLYPPNPNLGRVRAAAGRPAILGGRARHDAAQAGPATAARERGRRHTRALVCRITSFPRASRVLARRAGRTGAAVLQVAGQQPRAKLRRHHRQRVVHQ